MKLNTTALSKNTSTPTYRAHRWGVHGIAVDGDLDGETLTLQASLDQGATWQDYTSNNEAVTYSASADTINQVNVESGFGMHFRWTMSNGAGTPSGVIVHLDGENIALN